VPSAVASAPGSSTWTIPFLPWNIKNLAPVVSIAAGEDGGGDDLLRFGSLYHVLPTYRTVDGSNVVVASVVAVWKEDVIGTWTSSSSIDIESPAVRRHDLCDIPG